ncbi:MAG: TrkA family potassium uptake protein, partial [Cyclobacteriaceae bacterium]|nr:TrkA family potassium uptake protein [Cyclobacteriaceae bacterium]
VFSEELIAYAHEDHEYDIKQFLITGSNPLINMPYEKAFFDLKKQCNIILIGIVKSDQGDGKERRLLKNPDSNVIIEKNDYLLMMMNRKGQDRLNRWFQIEEGV